MCTKGKMLPLISSIQKVALYETRDKFFIVGSNNNQTKFRVLKVDRMDPYELIILDDQLEYSDKEVHQILQNGMKFKGTTNVLPKPISAFGIVGFVKFLEGYYLILVTKRRRVASLGLHVLYKIEDTNLLYVPHESCRIANVDESRYLKMFQSVDLSSNFYFSYSYDITRSYQINVSKLGVLESHSKEGDLPPFHRYAIILCNCSQINYLAYIFVSPMGKFVKYDNLFQVFYPDFSISSERNVNYGVRFTPNRKFVWNDYLLSKIEKKISTEWILYVMHGFIGQSNVSVFGRSIYVTLIARRSNKYAGTRFLKRGANSNGDVANEVETEQMVIDVGLSTYNKMRVSSFVQLRGSVPSQWSQDVSKMVAKPAITFDLSDPYYEIAGSHFNELLSRYGSPVIILNLVKQREKKKHESQLSEQFNSAVIYLNQFLPPPHRIHYVSFDMARMNKGKEAKVMGRLAKIARSAIAKIGFFVQNGVLINDPVMEKVHPVNSLQTGVIRVNCVDCLDRTNTAQFALGKCALGYQLYYLGLLDSPSLEFDSDCVRLLEVLYEDHGDTLALQYGGSQLVHRIKTYRKTAPWTSQGNDIMQTLSRYYSNTFSDAEKQHAINLFLGLFIPSEHKHPIWQQNTDYYLHHPEAAGEIKEKRVPLTQWWERKIIDHLPIPYDYLNENYIMIVPNLPTNSEYTDVYHHYHRTDKFSVMGETYEFKISHSVRDFMPQCVTDYSPFTVRVRPGRMREGTMKNGSIKNPSLTGRSSTSSNNSSTSSSYESDDDDDDFHTSIVPATTNPKTFNGFSEFSEIILNDYEEIKFLSSEEDRQVYQKYELMGKLSRNMTFDFKAVDIIEMNNHQFDFTIPTVDTANKIIYEEYTEKCINKVLSLGTPINYKKYLQNELRIFY